MDLMFLADKADQEASKEAGRLQDMQRAPSHSEEGLFDNRVGQRRVWMAKNEVALQVIGDNKEGKHVSLRFCFGVVGQGDGGYCLFGMLVFEVFDSRCDVVERPPVVRWQPLVENVCEDFPHS